MRSNPGDERKTPRTLFDNLHGVHRFTVDAAATAANALLPRFWTFEDSGLGHSWRFERVWCNPPYSRIEPWVAKATHEHECPLVVMLVPADRTEQRWWQKWVELERDRPGGILFVRFLPGRLRFAAHDREHVGPNERPKFGCALLTWDRR